MKYQNDIKCPKTVAAEQSETEKSAGYASGLSTRSAPEDRRHLYGVLFSLPEFREAYHSQTGYCRGCRAVYPEKDLKFKGLHCTSCGRPRVFGALQYAWNGWIGDLPPGRYRGRSIERLLATDGETATLKAAAVLQELEA